jgi:hypothetical protein
MKLICTSSWEAENINEQLAFFNHFYILINNLFYDPVILIKLTLEYLFITFSTLNWSLSLTFLGFCVLFRLCLAIIKVHFLWIIGMTNKNSHKNCFSMACIILHNFLFLLRNGFRHEYISKFNMKKCKFITMNFTSKKFD